MPGPGPVSSPRRSPTWRPTAPGRRSATRSRRRACRTRSAGDTSRRQFCGVGSLKTTMGHMVGASGVAAVTKVVKALETGVLPPTANFEVPNPYIDFPESPLYVHDRLADWDTPCGTRDVALSARSASYGPTATWCWRRPPPPRHRPGQAALLPHRQRPDRRGPARTAGPLRGTAHRQRVVVRRHLLHLQRGTRAPRTPAPHHGAEQGGTRGVARARPCARPRHRRGAGRPLRGARRSQRQEG